MDESPDLVIQFAPHSVLQQDLTQARPSNMRIVLWAILLSVIFAIGFRWGKPQAPFKFSAPLSCYQIKQAALNVPVGLSTQFGAEQVTVLNPEFMCTPVTKKDLPAGRRRNPVQIGDHLQCYKAEIQPENTSVNKPYLLTDQFEKKRQVTVDKLLYLCEPTDKTLGYEGPPPQK